MFTVYTRSHPNLYIIIIMYMCVYTVAANIKFPFCFYRTPVQWHHHARFVGIDSWHFIDCGTVHVYGQSFPIHVDCHITRGVSTTVQITEMVFSCYKKQRILYLHTRGYEPPTISRLLESEGMVASRKGIARFLKCYHQTRSIFK